MCIALISTILDTLGMSLGDLIKGGVIILGLSVKKEFHYVLRSTINCNLKKLTMSYEHGFNFCG